VVSSAAEAAETRSRETVVVVAPARYLDALNAACNSAVSAFASSSRPCQAAGVF
jgi:hypothetical protein